MKIEVQGEGFVAGIEYDENQGLPLWQMLVTIEKAIIEKVLNSFRGNKARTADHLRLNRTTLVEKTKKYGFPKKSEANYN